jgi:GNAT superfamily N-acetyltransferase
MEVGDIFVADHGVEPVGMLRIEYFLSDVPLIASVFVLDTFRRRGVGRLLVDYAGRSMRERGHRLLYTSAGTDRSTALTWMRHLGFSECGFLAGAPGESGTLFLRRPL